MYTLDLTKKNRIPVEMEEAIAISFPVTGAVTLPAGTMVTLQSDGNVAATTNGTAGQHAIGFVTVPNINDTKKVTVVIFAVAKVRGIAGAAITLGQRVTVHSAVNASNVITTNYKPVATTEYAYGIAMNTAATNAEVMVAVFTTPNYNA